jgi:photoactive yellow protein
MIATSPLSFAMPGLGKQLDACSAKELDHLDVGVIGFDIHTKMRRYNEKEAGAAGLSPQRVLGQPLFTNLAPCLNNFLAAQRFGDAMAEGAAPDATTDYVLTLPMRPVKVALGLLATPGSALRCVLVQWQG